MLYVIFLCSFSSDIKQSNNSCCNKHLERNRIRNPNRKIRKHSKKFILLYALECEVVCNLVYRQEQVMVCRPANGISDRKEEG